MTTSKTLSYISNNKLYLAISLVSLALFGYDLWISIQLSYSMGTAEIFSNLMYSSGQINFMQLPSYAFWLAAFWAGIRRWYWFSVLLLIFSPLIVYGVIDNLMLLKILAAQMTALIHYSSAIWFLSISAGLKTLLLLLALWLFLSQLRAKIAAFKKTKKPAKTITTNPILIAIGSLGVLLLVAQMATSLGISKEMAYTLPAIIQYCVVSSSLLLWIGVIFGGFKHWKPALELVLLLSPLLFITSLIALGIITDPTSLLIKAIGVMQLVLIALTVITIPCIRKK